MSAALRPPLIEKPTAIEPEKKAQKINYVFISRKDITRTREWLRDSLLENRAGNSLYFSECPPWIISNHQPVSVKINLQS